MKLILTLARRVGLVASIACAVACASRVSAQIVAPSIYTTGIQVQGEPAGSEYADWALAGIPVVVSDPEDNLEDLDIANIQIANDDDFIYIRATTFATSTISLLNIFLAFDTDQDLATGFDILQIGRLGSELGYQNDYPFAQHADAFNLNISLVGGPVNNGGALIFPFWADASGPQGTQMEWAIPRDVIVQYPPALGGPGPSFPNPSFDFVVYTPQGLGDVTELISYTLAEAPASDTDFDGDGDTDGEDLLRWQRGLGITTGATNGHGDANDDDAVDADDLALWTANFGTPDTAVVAAIPEPTTMAMAAGAAVLYGLRRRR